MARAEQRAVNAKQDLQQLNVRVPRDVYDALRTYAYATDSSINDVVMRALADLLTSQARQEEVDSFLEGAQKQYRVALDKLADL